MSDIFSWPLRQVVEVSASASPTPGGGSVAAMVAGLGTAMVAMVANLTVGKDQYAGVEEQVQAIRTATYELLAKLEQLVAADMGAFDEFMRVLKLPRDTEEQKTSRGAALQRAYIKATDTPLEICRTCLEALRLADQLAEIGNKGAISDVGVAAYVAEAALNSALLSVEINLPGIKDRDYVTRAQQERDSLVAEAQRLRERALVQVRSRMQ